MGFTGTFEFHGEQKKVNPEIWSQKYPLAVFFFFPVKLKSARETHFFWRFWVFSRAERCFHAHFFPFFSRPLFFFTGTRLVFFHGQKSSFTGRNLVFPQLGIFSQLSPPSDKILFENPSEIEYESIIFRDQ